MSYIERYPLQEEINKLKERNCAIVAVAEIAGYDGGYVILWRDEKGHTVTHVERLASGSGGIRSREDSIKDFLQAIEIILHH